MILVNCTNEIFLHQYSLQNRPYDAKRQKKNIQVDFGVNFLTACNKFLQQNNSAEAHLEIKNVKEKCMSMLEEALSQVTCRLPSAIDTFESLKIEPCDNFKSNFKAYVF